MISERPPVIGMTCSTIRSELSDALRYCQNLSYVRAVASSGGAPLLIPDLSDKVLLRSLYERCDGLLLPGGGDIDPVRFGEPRHEKCGQPSPERDEVELTLILWAVQDQKPLLAICRGIQVLNVALEGTLFQDIAAQFSGADRHDWYPNYPRDRRSHVVEISPNTRLAELLGEDPLPVNSLHHQAVKDIGPQLTVAARAPDGVIEGLEVRDHPFALGVQWHPEELAPSDQRAQRLFTALVQACLR